MKGTNFLRVSSIFYFAVVAKAASTVPKFEVSEERTSLDGAPSVVVTFPDGYTDTILLSRHYANDEDRLARNDDCNFIGHLTNEPETCVAMTGCLGSDDVDFTIMSSHASGSTMFHWSKEGDVRLIEHHLSNPDNFTRSMDDDEVIIPEIEQATQHYCDENNGNNCDDLPATQLLKIKMVYDNTFKNGVTNIEKFINALWTHLQANYCHPSLKSKVKVEKVGNADHVKKNMLNTKGSTLDDFAKGNTGYLNPAHLVAYLGLGSSGGFSGLATRDSVCLKNTHQNFDTWKSSINLIGTGRGAHAIAGGLLAHEIGHNLGMAHDFAIRHGGGGDGTDKTSTNPCNHQGVMSYGAGSKLGQWSVCSVKDFKGLYNERKNENNGEWCLKATQDNFCGTQTLCNKATFKDGICDPQNNNRVCGYDGGDCCNKNTGWDNRCKAIGDPLKCKCIEECKDNENWCKEDVCWSPHNSNSCKRTCKLCTPDLNLAIGLENGGKDCLTDCKGKEGKCGHCGFDGYCCKKGTSGNECDGSFGGENEHQCVLKPSSSTNECKDSQPTFWKNNYLASYGDICENYVGPKKYCDIKWGEVCDGKKCGEFCKKTCNKC